MKTRSITLSPDEVLDILKERFKIKDARVHCLTGRDGMSWEGLCLEIHDKWEAHLEFMNDNHQQT